MSSSKAVVLVTGSSRGIGLAIVQKLLADGVFVSTIQRSQTSELLALEKQYPNSLLNVQGSVTDPVANASVVSQTLTKFGQLDAVVLNAGIGVMGTVASGTLADWPRQFEINVFSLITTIQATLPALRESKRPGGGRVIMTSSAGAVAAPPGLAAYAAAKAAVNSIAHSLKNEEPSIISVAVHPGLVQTDMTRELVNTGKDKVPASTHGYFVAGMDAENSGVTGIHASVPPEVPAKTFAWLALNAPQELNGNFYVYCQPEITKLVEA